MILSEWLLVIITIAIGTMTFFVVRLVVNLGPAVASLRRTSDRVGQATMIAESMLEEVRAEVQQLQTLTTKAGEVLADVGDVTHATREVAFEAAGIVNLVGVTRRTRAVTAGAKIALGLLRNAVAGR